jgi:hypothetical protein
MCPKYLLEDIPCHVLKCCHTSASLELPAFLGLQFNIWSPALGIKEEKHEI